jgi:hypothetical protein
MYLKRTTGAAAIAVGIGISAALTSVGPAAAAPCDQSPNQPSCQPTPAGPGGQQGNGPQSPQNNGSQAPQTSTPAPQQNNPPQTGQPNSPQPQQSNTPQNGQGNSPQGPQRNPSQNPQENPPGGRQDNPQGNPPQESPGNASNPAPGQQQEPGRYVPNGHFDRGNAQVGGPTDAPHGFSTPDNGAPPAPPEHGLGWNDGPAPGGPPPNWEGPAPAGGWDGPPPAGGWNRHYDGPQRDIAAARADFGPFNYNGYTATPIFNAESGGWGFWFFGVWIPLF